MKIGIDASRANASERTGTEWYAYHLVQALKRIEVPGLEYALYAKEPLRDGLEALPPEWSARVLGWPPKRFWNQLRLSWELARRPVDLFFQPTHTLPLFTPRRVVATLHDVGFEKYPKLFRPSELRYHRHSARLAVRRSNRLLTVSEFSKREIMEAYKVPAERITVTPLAHDPARYRPDISDEEKDATLSKYRLSRPYFLYAGRLEEKKNIANLLHAFAIFKGRRGVGDPIRLVLAGTPGLGIERIRREIVERKLEASVVMPGYVPEEDMPALYASAYALAFPSRYEGFGLPIVQAQACGVPVMTSRAASMPEVAGEAAIFVDPEAPEDIARAMKTLLDETVLWERLRVAGLANVKRFSWDETARLTMNLLLEVLGIQRAL